MAIVLAGVPRILTGVATIIAMVTPIITAVQSAATGERANHGSESCEKREAQHGILRCGLGGCFHGFGFWFYFLGFGFDRLGRVS